MHARGSLSRIVAIALGLGVGCSDATRGSDRAPSRTRADASADAREAAPSHDADAADDGGGGSGAGPTPSDGAADAASPAPATPEAGADAPPPVCTGGWSGDGGPRLEVVTSDVTSLASLETDGSFLYFSGAECSIKCYSGPYTSGTWRVPNAGGAVEHLSSESGALFPPTDGALYWQRFNSWGHTGGDLSGMPTIGGPSTYVGALPESPYETVIGAGLARALRVDPLGLLAGNRGRVVLLERSVALLPDGGVPREGGTNEERELSLDFDLGDDMCLTAELGLEGDHLYAALQRRLFEVTAGSLVPLGSVDGCVEQILPHAGYLYVVLSDGLRAFRVGRVPMSGGPLEVLDRAHLQLPTLVGPGGGFVYWLGADEGCGELHAIREATGESMSVPVPDAPLLPWTTAVDDGGVYWLRRLTPAPDPQNPYPAPTAMQLMRLSP